MASGVSTGKDLPAKHVAQILALLLGQILDAAQEDAFLLEGRQQFAAQTLVGLGEELADGGTNLLELFARRHAVGPGADVDARLHLLLQAADAHHEELIEIRGEDGQELEPFEQRHRRVLRFFEDAAIEFQPAQFAVDVELGIVKIGNGGRRLRAIAGRSGREDARLLACEKLLI